MASTCPRACCDSCAAWVITRAALLFASVRRLILGRSQWILLTVSLYEHVCHLHREVMDHLDLLLVAGLLAVLGRSTNTVRVGLHGRDLYGAVYKAAFVGGVDPI